MMQEKEKIFLAETLGNEGVFDEFYLEYLKRFEQFIDKLFAESELKFMNDDKVKTSILLYLKGGLIDISITSLIRDLHDHKEEFVNNDIEMNYKKYCKDLLSGGRIQLLNKYSQLNYLIENKIETTQNMITMIFDALENDSEMLARCLEIDTSSIVNIELGQGDTHNHGKTVAIIEFDKQKKVVFKPRSMAPEISFAHICEWVNIYEKEYGLKCVKSVDCGEYGYQEYINRQECKNKREVEAYFRRMGKYMAIFHIFNTSDLHAENILPCGEYPYFIDLETLMTAHKKKVNDECNLSNAVQKRMENSVFSTSILPHAFKTKVLDVDISGLGAHPGQKSKKLTYKELVDKGTSNIRFEEKQFITSEMDNSVILNGEKVDYVDYVDYVEKGFEEVYKIFIQRRDELKEKINEDIFKGNYRQVLRGTFIYVRFLLSAMNPAYLSSDEERIRLLSLINHDHSVKGECEVEQMMENDVPYFMVEFDSKDLKTIDKVVQKDYFEMSLKDQVIESINSLSKKDMDEQLSFIRNSIILAKKDIMYEQKGVSTKDKIVDKDISTSEILDCMTEKIAERAIWNKDYSCCIFIDLLLDEKPVLGVVNDTLYDYIGLVWYLFTYADFKKDANYMRFAECALRGLEEIYQENNHHKSTATFSGYFSYIYLYFNLYRLTNDSKYKEKFLCLLKDIYEYDPCNEILIDIIAGISGAILVLANIYKIEKNQMVSDLISRYVEILSNKIDKQKNMLTGFSHGLAGMATALYAAGEALENESYKSKAMELNYVEDQFYSSREKNWLDLRGGYEHCGMFWCHGAPGILLGRSYLEDSKITFEGYKEIIKNIERTIENGNMNDSMCHGSIGNLDLLLTIAGNIEDEELYERVRLLYEKVIIRIIKDGVEYGIPQMRGLLSFMIGLSGIAYGILRYNNPSLPCVLALEVYRGGKDDKCKTQT